MTRKLQRLPAVADGAVGPGILHLVEDYAEMRPGRKPQFLDQVTSAPAQQRFRGLLVHPLQVADEHVVKQQRAVVPVLGAGGRPAAGVQVGAGQQDQAHAVRVRQAHQAADGTHREGVGGGLVPAIAVVKGRADEVERAQVEADEALDQHADVAGKPQAPGDRCGNVRSYLLVAAEPHPPGLVHRPGSRLAQVMHQGGQLQPGDHPGGGQVVADRTGGAGQHSGGPADNLLQLLDGKQGVPPDVEVMIAALADAAGGADLGQNLLQEAGVIGAGRRRRGCKPAASAARHPPVRRPRA